ncbi:MAG: tetratricopeptide repeat protein [Alphaproteobacteria bacterium]|nr:tetratricopeptide repeat protein [Alphaproteobacteria bacterium]
MTASFRAVPVALALLMSAAPAAHAATMVIGGGQAESCYKEADSGRASQYGLAICTGALEGDPLTRVDRAATFVNRGVIYLQRRDGKLALADLESALRLAPEIGEVHVNRGAALVMLGRYAEGEAALSRGIEIGSKQPQDAYFNRAIARESLGDLKGAYRDYVEAQRLAPEWTAPKVELARFSVSRPGE